jgi:hypothetical protein
MLFNKTNQKKTIDVAQATKKFKPKSDGGLMRRQHSNRSNASSTATTTKHVLGETLVTFSCAISNTFDLARFQDFVFQLPRDIVRGKGSIQFDCEPDVSYEFSLSGNGRHLDMETMKTLQRGTHLAFIGRTSVDVADLERRLLLCQTAPQQQDVSSNDDRSYYQEAMQTVEKDERFRAQLIDNDRQLLFRVTTDHIGIDAAELRAYHGVTLDKIARELRRAINAVNASRAAGRRTSACLVSTPRLAADAQLWLRFDLRGSAARFDSLWSIVGSVLDRTLARSLRGVSGCKCSY